MNRRNALIILFAIIGRRLIAQPIPVESTTHSLVLPDLDKVNHIFAGKVFNIVVDGRRATFTAKEIADALGAK